MSGIRHGTTLELLALRDGEGSAWTKDHVGTCAACAAELYRLHQVRSQLKALPSFRPPRDRWPAIALVAGRARGRRRVHVAVGLATAAALSGLAIISLHRAPPGGLPQDRPALRNAMARSSALEQTLKALAPEARVLSGEAASAVADLEDHLSAVDDALGDPGAWRAEPDRVVELWQQRAGILSALVDVHTTRVAIAGL